MYQYERRVPTIEAFRWVFETPPKWFKDSLLIKESVIYYANTEFMYLVVGDYTANPGDFIVLEDEKIKVYKKDEFNLTFKAID